MLSPEGTSTAHPGERVRNHDREHIALTGIPRRLLGSVAAGWSHRPAPACRTGEEEFLEGQHTTNAAAATSGQAMLAVSPLTVVALEEMLLPQLHLLFLFYFLPYSQLHFWCELTCKRQQRISSKLWIKAQEPSGLCCLPGVPCAAGDTAALPTGLGVSPEPQELLCHPLLAPHGQQLHVSLSQTTELGWLENTFDHRVHLLTSHCHRSLPRQCPLWCQQMLSVK